MRITFTPKACAALTTGPQPPPRSLPLLLSHPAPDPSVSGAGPQPGSWAQAKVLRPQGLQDSWPELWVCRAHMCWHPVGLGLHGLPLRGAGGVHGVLPHLMSNRLLVSPSRGRCLSPALSLPMSLQEALLSLLNATGTLCPPKGTGAGILQAVSGNPGPPEPAEVHIPPCGVNWKGVACRRKSTGQCSCRQDASGPWRWRGRLLAACQPLALSQWPLLSTPLASRSWQPSQKAAGSPWTGVSHLHGHLCPLARGVRLCLRAWGPSAQ